ncbi:MAG: hypothetical protein HY078_10515 [Elusimicrobia bacterium]|nr:hypothetical protein [Elusimicrobiota bacterium]
MANALLWSPFPAGSRRLRAARAVFWVAFLTGSAVYGRKSWVRHDAGNKNPLVVGARTRFHLWRLSSRDPGRAAASWTELQNIYLRSWQAFHIMAPHFVDDEPIHFRIRHRDESKQPHGVYGTFWASPERLDVYAKREPSRMRDGSYQIFSCVTVGEALLAMAYNENEQWRSPFRGDWQRWYLENRSYYPLSVRAAGMMPEKDR